MQKLTTFTVSIPDELKKEMDKHLDVNWTEYLKQRFESWIIDLEKFEELKNSGKI